MKCLLTVTTSRRVAGCRSFHRGMKKQITILVVSTEDDSVPDVGSASMDVTLTENMNTTVTLTTNVRENRGRYTGAGRSGHITSPSRLSHVEASWSTQPML
jgi:hypothetical protein